MNDTKYHFDKVQDFAGFAVENAKPGDMVPVLMSAILTSDDQNFHKYAETISNVYLNKTGVFLNLVHQFLVVIHENLSCDIYVNDFQVAYEIHLKRDVKKGEVLKLKDVADIKRVKFPEITITEMDKIIYCFKVGWRFGLYFDVIPRVQNDNIPDNIKVEKLDIEKMMISIGALYRHLTFYDVYSTLQSKAQFEEMKKDGWFPFIEMLPDDYNNLSKIYQNRFDFENRIMGIVNSYNETRIHNITERWWKNQFFFEKKTLIEAGVNAYLQNTQEGFINCIKNLSTEMEGLLRLVYFEDTSKGNNVKSNELISHIINKARSKSGSDFSLLFPIHFLEYLQNEIFANFNFETGNINLSRHSSSHGAVAATKYTKGRALQFILILDQIYFYI